MSTMTLRKRISLVAVSALTAGLLTVVAPQAANAGLTDATNVAPNSTNGAAGAVTSDTSSAGTGSVGLLAQSGEGTTQTAVLLSTGTVAVFLAAPTTSVTATASITGGIFSAVSGGTVTGTSLAAATASSTNTALGLLAKPSSGSTKMVINLNTKDSSDVETLSKRITVTVVATSVYNVYSPTYSWARWGAGDGTETAVTDATSTNYTTSTGLRLKGSVLLVDAYGNVLTSANTGLLTATVTAGAKVNLGSNSADGTTTFDSNSTTAGASNGAIPFNIIQTDTDVPWNGTVTFSFDGTVIATKSGIITGEVAKVTMSSPKIGAVSGSNTEAALIAYEDAKGNAVYPTSGTSAVSASLNSVVTGMSVGTYPVVGVTGKITITCATSGSANGLQMEHLNSSGTKILSNKWDAGCSTAPYTVTGSWDKASYTPGSIATLTLSYKDIYGNKANAYDSISVSAANTTMTITGAPSATPVTAIGNDKPDGVTGAKTYQFVVGSTEGDFVAVVVPTEIVENNSAQKNLSLPYTVKAATTSVSNADVLKSIVALIASINKQIQALQKLILKR